MHARDEQEHARLQAAFDEMRTANRAKTDFLRRMSHDIRTPLNGIIGLLKIDETHFEDKEMVMENHQKMQVAAGTLAFRLRRISGNGYFSKLELPSSPGPARYALNWRDHSCRVPAQLAAPFSGKL